MPNRLLRDWTQSDKMDDLTSESERFFTRLIMKADDFGCFYANPKLLKASLFPLKMDKIREADMLRWMDECQKAGLIVLYESNQKGYLQITDFGQRLRQKKSRFPLPEDYDSNVPSIDSNMRADDSNMRLEEKRSRREVEVEEKPPKNYWDKEVGKKHGLDHCMEIALKDDVFVKANRTNKAELEIFNDFLRKTGESEKDFIDYKKHFGNKKIKNPELFKTNGKANYKAALQAFRES